MDENELSDVDAEVLSTVRSAAVKALADSRAALSLCYALGPVIHLDPINPHASPLAVQIDSDRQISFVLGRHQVVYEVYTKNRNDLRMEVKSVVEAVISGGYAERVNIRPDHPDRPVRAVGTLSVAGGPPVVFTDNVLSLRRTDGPGWESVEYDPY